MGKLVGRTLDFGCGRGQDAHSLKLERFDPYYFPDMPKGVFNTVVVTYVLNTVSSPTDRNEIMGFVKTLLAAGGIAYFSVRNDKSNLNGWTSRGTWQGLIVLDLPVVTQNSNFTMYELKR
jgi:hypothetical protein